MPISVEMIPFNVREDMAQTWDDLIVDEFGVSQRAARLDRLDGPVAEKEFPMEMKIGLYRAFGRLHKKQQEIIDRAFFGGEDPGTIAKALNITIESVRAIKNQAILHLRQELGVSNGGY